jgi:hypothetical protein
MLLRAGEEVVVSKLDADNPFIFVFAEVESQTEVDGVSCGKHAGIAAAREKGIEAAIRELIRKHKVQARDAINRMATRQRTYEAKLKLRGGAHSFPKRPLEVLIERTPPVKVGLGMLSPAETTGPREDVLVGAIYTEPVAVRGGLGHTECG